MFVFDNVIYFSSIWYVGWHAGDSFSLIFPLHKHHLRGRHLIKSVRSLTQTQYDAIYPNNSLHFFDNKSSWNVSKVQLETRESLAGIQKIMI